MRYKEIEVKTALNPLKRKGLPYRFDLNIYRGCSHGCRYCYAANSKHPSGVEGFSREIFVKTNLVKILEKELKSPSWKGEIINIGGVCDSYQEGEKEFQLMRPILEVMIQNNNPVIISTKSDLILRDLDLIDELGKKAYVNIAFCITSGDPEISRKVEPGASLPQNRFSALKEFGKTSAYTAFHFMPIIPFLADDKKNLEKMVEWASEARVDYMLTGFLYLTGGIKKRFRSFVEENYPDILKDFSALYPKGGADREYKSRVHGFLAEMREKYGVSNNYSRFIPGKGGK